MSLLIAKNLPFFKAVPAKVLDGWLSSFQPQTKYHAKGTIIHFQGQPYTELAILLSGEVDAEIQDYDGKTLKVETLEAPEPIAAAVLFAKDNTLPVTTVAKTDVKLFVVPKKDILRLCRTSEEFLGGLLAEMGGKLILLAQKIRFLQFGTIRRKLAGYLLDEMRKQRSAALRLPYTKEVLSELFGVTRPSLSRVFAEFANAGILRQEGKTVHVLKASALKGLMVEDDCAPP